MSTPSSEPRYKLIFTVPHSSLEACKSAIFAKGSPPPKPSRLTNHYSYSRDTHIGAGAYPMGKYSMVSFESPGIEQFLPGEGAQPNIGEVGKVERVEQMRVEVLCVGRDVMVGAVEALKR